MPQSPTIPATTPDRNPSPVGAIYVRVSSDDQVGGYSIPEQREFCLAQAASRGFVVNDAHVLIDDGLPGDLVERPGLTKLRALVRQKEISAVFMRSSNRFSREAWIALMVKRELQLHGVALFIGTSQIDYSLTGDLIFGVMASMDQHQKGQLLGDTYAGKIRRAKAGYPSGGSAPLGYLAVYERHKGAWVIEPEEKALVQRIFAMYLDGTPMRAIARQLTAERLRTKSDRNTALGKTNKKKRAGYGVWSLGSIGKILTYEGYTGTATWRKRKTVERSIVFDEAGKHKIREKRQRTTKDDPDKPPIPFAVPQIITPETFQRVQDQMRRNAEKSPTNVTRRQQHLLTGKMFRCGRCGLGMVYGKRNRATFNYRCSSKNLRIDTAQRCGGSIRADEVEPVIWSFVENIFNDPKAIASYVERKEDHQKGERERLKAELVSVQAALEGCASEIQQILDCVQVRLFTLQDGLVRRQAVEARQRELKNHQSALQEKLDNLGNTDDLIKRSMAYVEQRLDERLAQELRALDEGRVQTPGWELTDAQKAMWRQDASEQLEERKAELRERYIRVMLKKFTIAQRRQAIQSLGFAIYFRPDIRGKLMIDFPAPLANLANLPKYWD